MVNSVLHIMRAFLSLQKGITLTLTTEYHNVTILYDNTNLTAI